MLRAAPTLTPRFVGFALALTLASATPAWALIFHIPADRPWHNDKTPLGADDVANLPGRLGGWEGPPMGSGEFYFAFRCDSAAAFNEALKTFAAIRTPRLEIVLHDGPGHGYPVDGNMDWAFTVWEPAAFHRLNNDPKGHFLSDAAFFREPVPAPKLDVYPHPGSPIDWTKVEVPPGVKVTDQRASAAPVKATEGGVVQADVYDMATGRPIPGAVLVARRSLAERGKYEEVARAAADENGRILLLHVPHGTCMLHVEEPNYALRPCGWVDSGVDGYLALTVELSKSAAISGTVTDPNGQPVVGAQLMAFDMLGIDGRGYGNYNGNPQPSAVTDAAGRFRVDGLPTGFAVLRCTATGLYVSSVELRTVPSSDLQISMIGTGTVRGKVTFFGGQSQPPELNVSIDAPGERRVGTWGGSARCKPDGSFEFTGVPAGEYCVHTGSEVPTRESGGGRWITVKPGAVVEVEVPY